MARVEAAGIDRSTGIGANTYLVLGLLLVLIVIPWILPRFYIDVLFLTVWYAALAQAWNFIGGYGKMLSLGHAAFVGVGAYTSTLLFLYFGITPWIGMFAAGVVSVLLSFVVGLACFRLSGAYFAISTLILEELLRSIFMEFPDITGGATGINIPFKQENLWFYMEFRGTEPFYYITLMLLIIISTIIYAFEKSDLGLRMTAIGEDQPAARSLGVPAMWVKQKVFIISAFFTGVLGVIHAQYLLLIQVNTYFDPLLSIQIALVAFIGGSRTITGPILGAFILIPSARLLQASLGGTYAGSQLFIYGLILAAIARYSPRGIWPIIKGWYEKVKP